MGYDSFGSIVFFSSFLFGLGAIPAGYFENKIGCRKLLLLHLFGSSVLCFFIFYSKTSSSFILGLCFLCLISSIYHPSGLTLISKNLKKIENGMAIHGVFGNVGLAFGPMIATIALTYFSWKYAYFFFGLINLIIFFFTLFFVRDETSSIAQNFSKNHLRKNNVNILLLFFLITGLLGMNYYGFTTFVPSFIADNTENLLNNISSEIKAGIFPTIIFASGMIGSVLAPKISSLFGKSFSLLIIYILIIPVLLFISLSTNYLLLFFCIVWAILFACQLPIANALVADITDNVKRGLGYGINFFVSFGIGAFAAYFSGKFAVKIDMNFIFLFMSIIMIPATISSFLIYLFFKNNRV
jgi:FSR family fosmidomycin resistance protein-like MFS transporter